MPEHVTCPYCSATFHLLATHVCPPAPDAAVVVDEVCRCGHPEAAHDAGECWTEPDAVEHPNLRCGCDGYEPAPQRDTLPTSERSR